MKKLFPLIVLLILASCKSTMPTATDDVNNSLLGYYECIGSDMQGNKFDPIGEWLELKADGSGKWFLGATEDNFKWTSNDKEINFDDSSIIARI